MDFVWSMLVVDCAGTHLFSRLVVGIFDYEAALHHEFVICLIDVSLFHVFSFLQ